MSSLFVPAAPPPRRSLYEIVSTMINRAKLASLDVDENLNWGHNRMAIFKKNQIGDGPVDAEYLEKMRALAKGIDSHFNGNTLFPGPKKVGFILMVFPFGDANAGRCNYMSNANRGDVVRMLEDQLAKFRTQEHEAEYAAHKDPNPLAPTPGEDDVLFRR